MARGRVLALVGFASLLTGLLACGQEAPGDIRTFAQYRVWVEANDQPDLNTGMPQRQLVFHFNGINVTSPGRCATFGDATATFSGQPVTIPDPGGWYINRVPTNTSPGQTINGDGCYDPFIEIHFDNPQGEPQDGTLAVDGAGTHLEVPFNHPFGNPALALVSASSTQIIVNLQNFLFVPTAADVVVTLTDLASASPSIAIQQTTLGTDGMLTLSLPAGAITRPVGADLLVVVNLGDDVIPCLGFKSCSATSRFVRDMQVGIPFP